MSARNKQRGYELEREVVVAAEKAGLEARRVFGSGAFKRELGEDFAGDVVFEGLRVECKRRKSGCKVIYDGFSQDNADVVVFRADRRDRVYCLKEGTFHDLLNRGKEKENVA